MKKLSVIISVLILCMTLFPLTCGAVGNQWIYYSNPNDIGRLYKQREDGTGITRLSMQSADNDNIEVLGGWVYHIDSGTPYRTKTDGSVTEKLSDITGCYGVYLDNGYIRIPCIYFLDDEESAGVTYSMVMSYSSKGYVGTDILGAFEGIGGMSCSCIESDGGYVYFSYGDNKYYRYRPEYSGGIGDMYDEFWFENIEKYFNNKAVRIGRLPQSIIDKSERHAPKISNDDFFRTKYLRWESFDGAEKYVIYRKNAASGKYKKLTETKNTSVEFTVLDSQYNDEYKVSAVRGSAKYKVRMTFPTYALGNTGGNISNGAFAAEYDGTYYVCLFDGIYKLDGTSKVKLFSGAADNISIAGSWIYFSCSDGLFRMKTDGTDMMRMNSIYCIDGLSQRLEYWGLPADCLEDELPDDVYVCIDEAFAVDDKVYVSLTVDLDFQTCRHLPDKDLFEAVLLINADDSGAVQLSDVKSGRAALIDNRIISSCESLFRTGLMYSMDMNGKDRQLISHESVLDSFCVYNGKIYYGVDNGIFSDENGLYSMNWDGTAAECIYGTNCVITSVNAYGERLYFAERIFDDKTGDFTYNLCSIAPDGSGHKALISGCEAVERINIVGDTLYLRAYDGRVFSCKTDGSGLEEL